MPQQECWSCLYQYQSLLRSGSKNIWTNLVKLFCSCQNFEDFHHNTDRMEKEEKSKKKRMAAKKKEFEERVRQFQETAHKYII